MSPQIQWVTTMAYDRQLFSQHLTSPVEPAGLVGNFDKESAFYDSLTRKVILHLGLQQGYILFWHKEASIAGASQTEKIENRPDWTEVLFVGNRAVLLAPTRVGQEAHVWAPCCDMHKDPAQLSLMGVPIPWRLGTSAPWRLDPVNRLWCRQKCTESASTLSREVIQGKSLTSLGHISQLAKWGDVPLLLSLLGCSVVRTRLPMQEMQDTRVWSLGQEDPLEKEMAIHFSLPSWEIPWTEKPGGLQDSKESDTTQQLNSNNNPCHLFHRVIIRVRWDSLA